MTDREKRARDIAELRNCQKNTRFQYSKQDFCDGWDARSKYKEKISPDQVEWIVNEGAELGVKIGNQFFFLNNGRSVENEGTHWRPVGKQEFGDTCVPWDAIERKQYGDVSTPREVGFEDTYIGFYGEREKQMWKALPEKLEEKV